MDSQQQSWIPIKDHPNYEMTSEEPFKFREKTADGKYQVLRICGGSNKANYIMLEKRNHYLIHRIIAQNLIPNPNNYKFVEFLDSNKQNYSLSNLRWASGAMVVRYHERKDGNLKLVQFCYKLPEGYEPLVYYNEHEFDDLFIKWENEIPNFLSFDTKRYYRPLNSCSGVEKYKPYTFYHDVNGKQVQILHHCLTRTESNN